uniref:Uncharacterized protein n=1 Tax=Anguilla anguilla TaxID=7936 RepID=A0A0E9QNZ5_ANGAN
MESFVFKNTGINSSVLVKIHTKCCMQTPDMAGVCLSLSTMPMRAGSVLQRACNLLPSCLHYPSMTNWI